MKSFGRLYMVHLQLEFTKYSCNLGDALKYLNNLSVSDFATALSDLRAMFESAPLLIKKEKFETMKGQA